MAKLFRPDGPTSGSICDPRATEAGLLLEIEGEEPRTMPYEGMTHRIGGYENSWIIVEQPDLPGLELWMVPAEVQRLAGPAGDVPVASRGVFEAMVAGHTEVGRKTKFKQMLALVAVLGVIAWMVSGGFTGLVVGLIPVSAESALGDMLAEGTAEDSIVCDDPALVGAVEGILLRLVDAMDDPEYTFRVRVARSPEVNAFALPGGEIFFNSALLEKAESVDEVAAVMGHEVQHVVHQHGLRGMVRSAGLALGLAVVFGDASETAATLAGYASSLTDLKFGRDAERESDRDGVALMIEAGFDPQGAVSFFGMLAEESGDTGSAADQLMAIASTHPASSERTERLRELAATGGGAKKAGPAVDWTAIRGNCSGPTAEPAPGG